MGMFWKVEGGALEASSEFAALIPASLPPQLHRDEMKPQNKGEESSKCYNGIVVADHGTLTASHFKDSETEPQGREVSCSGSQGN